MCHWSCSFTNVVAKACDCEPLLYVQVFVYNADYVKVGPSLWQDIVFMDPPWGGPEYKTAKSLDMFLGPTPLVQVCRYSFHRLLYGYLFESVD